MAISDSFSLSNTILAIAALFFLIGATLMSAPSAEQRKASKIGFIVGCFLIWFSMMSFVATVLQMSLSKRYMVAMICSALISAFLLWTLSIAGIIPQEQAVAQTPNQQLSTQNCNGGNCSFNQTGGTVIQNINSEPKRLAFDILVFNALVHQMQPQKPLQIVGVGNTDADQQSIQQYAKAFLAAGYQVQLITIGVSIPSPSKKVSLASTNEGYQLTIAPSAF